MDKCIGFVLTILKVASLVRANDVCYDAGIYYITCNDGEHCCENNRNCCTTFSVAAVIGLVFGCIAFLACCAVVIILAVKKKSKQGIVVNSAPNSGPVQVSTIQTQCRIHHGPGNQPYGQSYSHMPPSAPPYNQPSVHPPPYSQAGDAAYPPPPPFNPGY